MCIEKLTRENQADVAAALLRAYATVDFESSTRVVAFTPELWLDVRDTFAAGIRILAQAGDVNANWLGARWAAATTQSEFAEVVFNGFAGYPPGSESCFRGIASESLRQALGPAAPEALLERGDAFIRRRALDDLTADGTTAGIPLATAMAARDPEEGNRLRAVPRSCFQQAERRRYVHSWRRYDALAVGRCQCCLSPSYHRNARCSAGGNGCRN